MAWSSNVALESAAGVARLLGMDGDDVTRQINVHTQTSVHTRKMYSTFTERSRLFWALSRCFFGFSECKSVTGRKCPSVGALSSQKVVKSI